jgi:nucleotide-binding universal stress UspA family protein
MTVDADPIVSNTISQEDVAAASARRPYGPTLVVGHDGHPASTAALQTAIELAEQLDAHLHVLHSVTLDDYGIDPDIDAYEQECERNLTHERQTIADTFAATALRWTYHEERGDPASQLVRLATALNASFIIVGATGPGLLHNLLGSGSVPKRLLHHQHGAILVVPPVPTS